MPASDRGPLTAADVMTANPRTCSPFSTVLEAVLLFRDADCGAVPVLEDGKPIGILTDRDVALALADYEEGLPSLPVSQLMSKNIISVTPETPVGDVVDRLGAQGVRRLLVVDAEDRLVGIIGMADLAPHAPDQVVGRVITEVVEHP